MIEALVAQVETLEEAAGAEALTLDSAILTEQYFFWTVALMWLIHVGFMTYEAGVVRRKNVLATAMKNILTIAVVTPTLLLLRLVDLQLQHDGPADRADQTRVRLHSGQPARAGSHGRTRSGRTSQQHQPGLLPGLPPVLLDDGLDHVGGAAGAHPALGLPAARRAAGLGRLDPGRRLGLELRRLDDDAVRLPRPDGIDGRPRRRGPVRARRAVQPRAADREVHEGRPGPHLQTPEHPHDLDGADADLHRLLRLLRGLPGGGLDHLPGLGQHLPQPDDAGLDRDGAHVRLRRRIHGRLVRQSRGPVLDGFGWPRRRDRHLGWRRHLRAHGWAT